VLQNEAGIHASNRKGLGKMAGRKQRVKHPHYVPRMVLRRFSPQPTADNLPLRGLDKATGVVRRTSANNELVVTNETLLRRPAPDLNMHSIEDFFADVEGATVAIIDKLVEGTGLTDDERGTMAVVLFLQQQRTPRGRQWLSFIQEKIATMELERRLADRELVRSVLGEDTSDEEIERWQEEQKGKWVAKPSHDHEVAGMLYGIETVVPLIAGAMTWICQRTTIDVPFVISDHPLAIFDPRRGRSGGGWYASPGIEATMPLDARLSLLLTPGPPTITEGHVTPSTVADINLRAYASTEWTIYTRLETSLELRRPLLPQQGAAIAVAPCCCPQQTRIRTVVVRIAAASPDSLHGRQANLTVPTDHRHLVKLRGGRDNPIRQIWNLIPVEARHDGDDCTIER
jgi:hypothetical protein